MWMQLLRSSQVRTCLSPQMNAAELTLRRGGLNACDGGCPDREQTSLMIKPWNAIPGSVLDLPMIVNSAPWAHDGISDRR